MMELIIAIISFTTHWLLQSALLLRLFVLPANADPAIASYPGSSSCFLFFANEFPLFCTILRQEPPPPLISFFCHCGLQNFRCRPENFPAFSPAVPSILRPSHHPLQCSSGSDGDWFKRETRVIRFPCFRRNSIIKIEFRNWIHPQWMVLWPPQAPPSRVNAERSIPKTHRFPFDYIENFAQSFTSSSPWSISFLDFRLSHKSLFPNWSAQKPRRGNNFIMHFSICVFFTERKVTKKSRYTFFLHFTFPPFTSLIKIDRSSTRSQRVEGR